MHRCLLCSAQAQEDTEILRSVVNPLEEEIGSLKQQLKQSKERVSQLEFKVSTLFRPTPGGKSILFILKLFMQLRISIV